MEDPAVERMSFNDALAEEIRVLMTRRKSKQRELCAVLGLSHGQVSQRLSGLVPLRADEIDGIASFLGVGVADLVKRADDARVWVNAGMGDPWTHGDPATAEEVMISRGIVEPDWHSGTPGEIRTLLPRLDSNQQPCDFTSVQVSATSYDGKIAESSEGIEHLATVTPLHPGHARLTPRGPIIRPNPSNPTRPAIVGPPTAASAVALAGATADAPSGTPSTPPEVADLDAYRARRAGEATGRTA